MDMDEYSQPESRNLLKRWEVQHMEKESVSLANHPILSVKLSTLTMVHVVSTIRFSLMLIPYVGNHAK